MDDGFASSTKASKIFGAVIAILCIGGVGFGIWFAMNHDALIASDEPIMNESEGLDKRSTAGNDTTEPGSEYDTSANDESSEYYLELLRQELARNSASSSSYQQNYNYDSTTTSSPSTSTPTDSGGQTTESSQSWCSANQASLYSKYQNSIITAYNRSLTSCNSTCSGSSMSNSSFGGNAACSNCRSNAQSNYAFEKMNLVNEYVAEAQSHGCDPYSDPYAISGL